MSQFKIEGDGRVRIGRFTTIGAGAEVVFAKQGEVEIGDYCSIGPGVKIVCAGGDVRIGDWSTLHDDCLVLSGTSVRIGSHCWFGQNCVIDGTGGLTIGRGVRVGMYSQIWSHVAAGEQIEGCTLFGERPVVLEDDVWLVGSCIVASGVILGRRLVALIGSNITKSWPEYSVLAGTPAAPKPGLSFYQNITLEQKWDKLQGWLAAAASEIDLRLKTAETTVIIAELAGAPEQQIAFARDAVAANRLRKNEPRMTVCCIEDKSYNKQLNNTERRVLKYLAGNKARFDALA